MLRHFFALLLVVLTACSKDSPAPADPFLGRWRAESLRTIEYDATGQVTSDDTTTIIAQLDVAATALTLYLAITSIPSTETHSYTRSGPLLNVTLTSSTGGETYYAQDLTSDNFIFEVNGPRNPSQPYHVETIAFHR